MESSGVQPSSRPGSSGPTPSGGAEAIPSPIRGITLDSTADLETSVKVIASSSKRLTVRLVIDPDVPLSRYKAAVEQIAPHAYIMVEIADSEEMPDLTAKQIRERCKEALAAFGDKVDLWEVGNELNGDWVGTSPKEINAKAQAAYEEIRAGGGKTAITLNYWSSSDCFAEPWEATLKYAKTMPAALRQADYIFLSIYETACDPVQHPSPRQIGSTLNSLSKLFPKARLGIGEIGAQSSLDGSSEPDLAEKTRVADYYYGMQGELTAIVGERYVGGYFWWYFHRDVIEASGSQSLWPTIDSLTSRL